MLARKRPCLCPSRRSADPNRSGETLPTDGAYASVPTIPSASNREPRRRRRLPLRRCPLQTGVPGRRFQRSRDSGFDKRPSARPKRRYAPAAFQITTRCLPLSPDTCRGANVRGTSGLNPISLAARYSTKADASSFAPVFWGHGERSNGRNGSAPMAREDRMAFAAGLQSLQSRHTLVPVELGQR